MSSFSVKIAGGVLVTLAFFVLIGYIVRILGRTEATADRLFRILGAIACLLTALCTVLHVLYGGWPPVS
jgi:Na+-translocating ferredoxin:NAD+ oxidoreductase RnfA subunit